MQSGNVGTEAAGVEGVVTVSVVESVQRDIDMLGGEAARSGLAATALAMARELDDVLAEQECEECGHVQSWTPHPNSATSKSMCAKALIDVLRELRAMAPAKPEEDEVERARKRRVDRLARQSATGTAPPS